MPEEKPVSTYYIEFDMFSVTNDGNICAIFTPVGGPKKVVKKSTQN